MGLKEFNKSLSRPDGHFRNLSKKISKEEPEVVIFPGTTSRIMRHSAMHDFEGKRP